jgi:MYXO-CTERM domain-containing protein
VLVAPNVVLTARHCLGGIQQVLLGATSWVEQDGEFIQVVSERAHPTLDIGALVLQRDSTVTPRVIASGCVVDRFLNDGADVAIVGYGATDANATMFSTVLREAYTTIVDADCSDRAGCLSPGSELGAGGNGIDSCNGDSGGPLYLLTEHYDYLVGITSRAFSDATLLCSQGGIYVRPGGIIDWIEEVTQASIPRADCNTPPDPTVKTLQADSGEIGRTRIHPNDAEEANTHRYEVISGAANGEVGVTEDGVAFYRSGDDFIGTDSFTVRVTDDGVPALSSVVDVEVVVEEGGCGCRTSPTGSGAALWVVVFGLLAIRRRRR